MPRGRKQKAAHNDDLLSMALVGYESAKEAIEKKIFEIRKMIGAGGRAVAHAVESVTSEAKPKRRKLSAAARKSIAAAQRKRWAAVRAAKASVKKTKTKAKRTVKKAKAKAAVDMVAS